MEGYYTSTRPDIFLIRKKMGPGPRHSGWGPISIYNEPQYLWHLEMRECVYTHKGTYHANYFGH
jgi:hypothetical protein